MTRKMNHKTPTAVLRRLVEKPHIRATGWSYESGQKHLVYPRLVDEIFGKLLIALTPCFNSTPNYYVVRVGSGWLTMSRPYSGSNDEPLRDHLDEIYDAIREQFGEVIEEDEEDDRNRDDEWPMLNLEIGCSWGRLDWPEYPKKPKKRKPVNPTNDEMLAKIDKDVLFRILSQPMD